MVRIPSLILTASKPPAGGQPLPSLERNGSARIGVNGLHQAPVLDEEQIARAKHAALETALQDPNIKVTKISKRRTEGSNHIALTYRIIPNEKSDAKKAIFIILDAHETVRETKGSNQHRRQVERMGFALLPAVLPRNTNAHELIEDKAIQLREDWIEKKALDSLRKALKTEEARPHEYAKKPADSKPHRHDYTSMLIFS